MIGISLLITGLFLSLGTMAIETDIDKYPCTAMKLGLLLMVAGFIYIWIGGVP